MFISPKYDDCIKEIFRNEIVRKYFISDMLEIPIERIRSVRLVNTFLWKRYRNQKLGILDVLAELNDDTKINIELQTKAYAEWDKRQIFYLSKLYVSDLLAGEDYGKLRRCVGISILDFNLTDREEYHSVYRLRDQKGNEFSNMLEIHVLELQKKINDQGAVEEWIRFFNATSEEELDMLQTKNAGIQEAIREVKMMSLNNRLRARYEAHLKRMRDEKARERYLINRGVEQGIEQGIERGVQAFISMCREFQLPEEKITAKVAEKFGTSLEQAKKYVEQFRE